MNWRAIGIALAIALLLGGGAVAVVKLSSNEKTRLEAMHPDAKVALQGLIAELAEMGVRTFVGSTRRTKAEAEKLKAEGKASANLKSDWHTIGRAVDLYVYHEGKVDFNGKNLDHIKTMHSVAKKRGWRGIAFKEDGSKWMINSVKGPIWDAGHLEWRGGKDFAVAEIESRKLGLVS